MIRFSCFSLLLSVLLTAGCNRVTSVDEIDVASSGIQLKETSGQTTDTTADWPVWRGPNGNGIAPDQALPTTWSADEGILWRSNVPGRGHGSPIVVGDQILLATAIEKEQKQIVLAYDRATGQQRWQSVVHENGFPSTREVHRKGTNANGTIASDGERAYISFFNSGKVTATALDLAGNKVWQTELGAFNSKFGFAPSPILYKSFVIFAVDNRGGGYIAAVDSASGDIAWRIARPAENSHSTPTIANLNGKDQMLISGCHKVVSYDPATGHENWSTDCTTETTCGTIVASADRLFAAGGWPDKQIICLTADGKQVWDNPTKVYEPSMLLDGENLFAVNDDGIAYCWSAETGETRWKKRLGGNFSASPILCNGNLYASNLSGETFVFKASAARFEQVAVNRLGSDCYASPAVSLGQIFLRIGIGSGSSRQEQLVCIGATP
jgi:outer membrane protein assembly factor BamB